MDTNLFQRGARKEINKMGLLKDLFFGDAIQMGRMSEAISCLRNRVEILEDEKKYLQEYIDERMECIENNLADQIAEKCYVRSVSEDNLLYLLSKIREHKKKKGDK